MKNYHMQDGMEISCRNCDSVEMSRMGGRDNRMAGRQMNMMDDCRMQQQVTMAYVPWQELRTVYEPEKGLMTGTIFPELDKPFYGRGGKRR